MANYLNADDSLATGYPKINAAIGQAEQSSINSDNAIDTANSAVSVANQALSNSQSTQEQLNQIVVAGDSSVEAAQARINSDGSVTYATLKERLDTEHTEHSSQLAETPTKDEARLKTEKIELEDMSENTLGAMSGNATFNILSKPQYGSVSTKTVDDYIYKQLVKVESLLGSQADVVIDEKDIQSYGYNAGPGYSFVNGNPSTSSGLLTIHLRANAPGMVIVHVLERGEGNNFRSLRSQSISVNEGSSVISTELMISEGQYVGLQTDVLWSQRYMTVSHFRLSGAFDNTFKTTTLINETDYAFFYRVGGIENKVQNILESGKGFRYVGDYGDDGDAIISALNESSYGDAVVLKSGHTYITTKTIWIPDGVSLITFGTPARIKLADAPHRNLSEIWWRTDGGKYPIVCNEFADTIETRRDIQVSNIHMENIIIEGNTDELISEKGIIALLLTNAKNCLLKNVHTENINYFPSAIDPSKGFGITTRYCKDITIENPSGEKAHYQNLGIYDGSEDVTVVNPRMGKAGRTSGQVHRETKNIKIIGGYFRNEGSLDGNTVQAFTTHGLLPDGIVEKLEMEGVECSVFGEYAGRAADIFGGHINSKFDLIVKSDGTNGVMLSGAESSVLYGVVVTTNPNSVGVTLGANNNLVEIPKIRINASGVGMTIGADAKDTVLDNYHIVANDYAIRTINLEDISIGKGYARSKTKDSLFSNSANVLGYYRVLSGTFVADEGMPLNISVAAGDRKKTIISDCVFERVNDGLSVNIAHDNVTFKNNIVKGSLRLRENVGCVIKDNELSVPNIEFVGTTEDNHLIAGNYTR